MVSISSNNVEFNVNEVLSAMNQSIHSETISKQLFMEETSTVTGEDVFPNSLPASPDKSSSQTENMFNYCFNNEKFREIEKFRECSRENKET